MTKHIYKYIGTACMTLVLAACNTPSLVHKTENKTVPASYNNSQAADSVNTANVNWKDFFTDTNLVTLIDTALKNNQELNIIIQEINIARNEVKARKGEYLPFVHLMGGAGAEKTSRYTRNGVVETNNITPGKEFPDPLGNYIFGANLSWEIDIWKKLRNAKKSAMYRYLSTIEGKNFMVTRLVSEIANSYYELMALDNQLEILKRNIAIQQNALQIVRLQKQAARVTELAVRKFEAEVLKNRSRLYYIQQRIIETNNRLNFLVGRYPTEILRNSQTFSNLVPDSIQAGFPSQLLTNRTDIKQAELQLAAAKLDVKVARANFYPSLRMTAGVGYQAFNPSYLLKSPESLLYNIAGDLMAPLVNRNAIKASYRTANSKQVQAVYNYERTLLKAYIEVVNQLSNISNLQKSYDMKSQQVQALSQSINISINLFQSARANYMEVLLTQRDALEAKMELVENKKQQMNAMVNVYRALGGGWK